MSELRQRQPASTGSSRNTESTTQRRQERRADAEESHGLSTLDIIRIIATLIIASCGLSYYITNSESLLWGYRPWFTRWPVVKSYLVLSPLLDRSRTRPDPKATTKQDRRILTLQSPRPAQLTSPPPNSPSTTAQTPPSPSTSPSTAPSSTSPPTQPSTGPAGATISSPGATPRAPLLRAVSRKT